MSSLLSHLQDPEEWKKKGNVFCSTGSYIPHWKQNQSCLFSLQFVSQDIAPCKGIQDSVRFWTPRRGFWIPVTRFQIFFSGTWIPDSYSYIPESKAQDSGFHKQKFSIFPYLGRKIDPWPVTIFSKTT